MKAAVCRRYGPPDVVEIADVPRPRLGANDVLIKVRATTVTAADWRLRSFTLPRGFGLFVRLGVGISGPRQPILGSELAGEVVAARASRAPVCAGRQGVRGAHGGLPCGVRGGPRGCRGLDAGEPQFR